MTANRRSRCAGRGALLWGLGLFACLQVALLALTDSWLVAWRDPPFAARASRLRHRLEEARRDTTDVAGRPRVVVALGSSHVLQGIPGLRIEERLGRELGGRFVVYNLGILAATPMDELLTWERLRDQGISPDLLLVEALPMNLDRRFGIEAQASRVETLSRRDLALMRGAGMPTGALRRSWLEAATVPAYSRRRTIVSSVVPSLFRPESLWDLTWPQVIDDSGWLAQPSSATGPEHRRRVMAALRAAWPDGIRVNPGGLPCAALAEILRECRAQGVPAALVVMPESPEFRGWYRPEERKLVEAAVAGLGQRYEVPVVQGWEWLGEEEFVDGHHLLPAGAARFADRLSDEFLLPFFRGLPTKGVAAAPEMQRVR